MTALSYPRPMGVLLNEPHDSLILAEDRERERRILAESRESVRFVGSDLTLGLIVETANAMRAAGIKLTPTWILNDADEIIGVALMGSGK